jgi:hypothetical protein
MARRSNLVLLAALAVSFATGVLALWVGAGRAGLAAFAHGGAGFAVLLLVRFKAPVVRRGLRRARADRGAAVVTAVLAVLMLAAGIAHSLGLATLGPVTVLAVHIAIALALVPLVLLHVCARPQRPRRGDLTRAGFLRLAGLALGALAVKAAFEGSVAASRAPTGSLPRAFPVPTSWLDDSTPAHVAPPFASALARLPRREVSATLDCTSGWYATNRWSGVSVRDLLTPLPAGTRSVLVRSATGYSRRFDVADLDALLLATHVDGAPLAPEHGAPARLVVPGRRGFWWVKWVTSIEPSDRPGWWQLPFPIS